MVAADLVEFRDAVADELERFAARRRAELADVGTDLAPFLDSAVAFVAGGKRLRPLFCRAGWLVAGGDPDDPALVTAAASLEWLQASALVHDDLMDGSDTRRGHPSVHRDFEARHRAVEGSVGDAARFGQATAVLLGDLMLSWADEQLRSSGLPRVPEALRYLDLCRSEVVAGQYLDVLAQTRATVTVEEAMTIVRFKAASYTVERPLHIGAALAGADDALVAGLSAIAVPLGQAFQLRDDVLGVFGDPAATGKPAGDDLREGKRTVLVARALELGSDDDRELLTRLLGTREGVAPLTDLMTRTGALAAVERDIARLEDEVDEAIDALGPAARDVLAPLALSATRRSS
ncbi:polyprenyl synthetase family protein [Aeromicrobium sp. REDSEA-S38_B2]|uniref:polyprenyl synthetase family protein n=2 Tax=unclassified Aeromicrobium TaxID=2633570 RepID=UPI00257D6334|nr:polyprenyl synthetase family protein [Aeromicrobium sp. REDSEA-S38_B2]